MNKIANLRTALLSAATGGLLLTAAAAYAATDTSSMTVRIVIQSSCDVHTVAPTDMDFGTQGALTANIDQTSTITLTCTPTTTYDVGLNGGGSGNINARVMINGTEDVGYQLYSNAGRTTVWGNTVGTDTVAGTGNGSAQTLTVYGRVPPQTTPPANTYTDTVTVTVTY